ncbi:MAG: YceI family protein [Desulfuromonadales bacterium]|jgi:hypothetical protein
MKRHLWLVITAVLSFTTIAHAETFDGRCAIRFYGQSTLHDFQGQALCEPFSVTDQLATAELQMNPPSFVDVLVSKMDTDNTGRDEKMRTMFESEKFPAIQGQFNGLNPKDVLAQLQAAGESPANIPFTLKIKEITQPIQATAHDLVVTPEQIRFVMEFPVSLSAFALEPPSVLGLIRVDNRVDVEVQVILSRQDVSAQ